MIALWDLFIHTTVLCVLILMFRQPPLAMNNMISMHDPFIHHQPPSIENYSKQSTDLLAHNKNFISSSVLLNRILEKRNISHASMGLNARNFYSNLDLMTIKWAASLSRRM